MAGLKKKRPEKSGSPNVVLVIFLVFFVLVTIGLGIFSYYGYAEQSALRKAKVDAETAAKGANQGKRFYAMQYRYIRTALGDKLDEKETGQLNDDLDEFFSKEGGGVFKDEADKEASRIFLADLKKKLGSPETERDFKTDFPKELKFYQDKAKEWEAKVAAANARGDRAEALAKKLGDKQDTFNQKTSDDITKENAALLAAAKQKSDEFKNVTANNLDLIAKLKEKDEEIGNKETEHANALKALARKYEAEKKELIAASGAGAGAPQLGAGRGDASPLLLDISMGKPLWDLPVGKIIRVDLQLRQVTINLGHSHGAKPELTFNIFGANPAGRPEKQLRGSIEIIKVIDANTSQARVTSIYDAEGHEIPINMEMRGRILRETEAPIKEGDLLFNLFWGARVAVVGYVSVTGEPTDNPADQNRQMEDFMHMLKRNGMQVDAFVDLRDGKINGAISAKTRYLIRGDDLRVEKDGKAPKAADDEKKDDKEPAKEGLNLERNEQINKSSRTLFNDAKERGLLMISAENFATVIGYRKARSANTLGVGTFRPGLPYAGAGQTGVLVLPDNRPPREEDKKDAEMEKK